MMPPLMAYPKKQQAVIRHLIAAARPLTAVQLMAEATCTQDPIRRLHKKGLLKSETRREMTTANPTRWQVSDGETERSLTLTKDQSHALQRITARRG